MAGVYAYDMTMLIWLDESGCDQQNSTRRQVYSIHGIRLVDHRILIHRVRYSAIPIILVKGIHVQLTESSDAKVLLLPPYPPDLNPP